MYTHTHTRTSINTSVFLISSPSKMSSSASRPFIVTGATHNMGGGAQPPCDDGEDPLSGRQDSLLPGQIRTPLAAAPSPLVDWGRGDSSIWGNGSTTTTGAAAGGGPPHHQHGGLSEPRGESENTPLGGYGGRTDIWSTPTTQQELGGGDDGGFPSRQHSTFEVAASDGGFSRNHSTQFEATNNGGADAGGEGTDQYFRGTRTVSELLSDRLHRDANTFPPPPPAIVPIESRRARAELWYYYGSKWDITHRLPPPPRNPLAGMEEEHRLKLQELTRVPYRGDRWLKQCQNWFTFVQDSVFQYPLENLPIQPMDTGVVLSMVA